jgi:hypothetical protein
VVAVVWLASEVICGTGGAFGLVCVAGRVAVSTSGSSGCGGLVGERSDRRHWRCLVWSVALGALRLAPVAAVVAVVWLASEVIGGTGGAWSGLRLGA